MFWLYLFSVALKGWRRRLKTNIVPEGYQKAQLYEGDTMAVVNLREVFIYPQVKFKNKREQAKYNKLVRDVKLSLCPNGQNGV